MAWMRPSDAQLSARLNKWGVILAVTGFVALAAVALGTGRASGSGVFVIGASAPATPSCPNNCQITGRTTGFQTAIGNTKKPFRVPFPGKIVAWSIKLSRPTAEQIKFGNELFSGPPKARIGVLKPIKKKIKRGKPVYKLKGQSPVELLTPFLGTTTTFTLNKPINVKAGQLVALTLPTWAPVLAIGQSKSTGWRASRKKGKCGNSTDANVVRNQLKGGTPQTKVGSLRPYWCAYGTARLLYTATMVRRPSSGK
jgi:hypothetical protein